ncbi:MAG: alcohol dehydrogenase catalytic domain-containing protein [Acidobacteria bacterium]|nr:alcohol dehydrogenase catalytic domain-containing protein [Acidobacteriota bacterium]
MIAAELVGARRFELKEIPLRDPSAGEVQVRVKSVGICGSDLHYYFEGGIGDTSCIFPMVLGHEPSGEVVKVGSGVSGWSTGDRAILEPALYCYHCEYCMAGKHNVCEHLRFLSTPTDPGFFREYVNLPLTNVIPLPKEMSFEAGTLAEPLAVVMHSMKFADPRPGESVAVFGAGPIGLLTLSVLRLSAVGRIFVVEPVAHRRELALRLGADVVIDPKAEDVVQMIRQGTRNQGVDLTIDCAAKGGSMNHSLFATRNAGRVVYTGIPSEMVVPMEFHEMRRKELSIFNVRRSNHETDVAIRLLVEHPQRFLPILTHQRPVDKIAAAFDMLEHYDDGAAKVTIQMSR